MSFKPLTKNDYINICNHLKTLWELNRTCVDIIMKDLFVEYRFSGYEFGKRLGEPFYIDKFTENNQGIWIYKDETTDLIWVYYSDAYKSNHYKGGSFEFYSSDVNKIVELKSEIILDSFKKLLNYLSKGISK